MIAKKFEDLIFWQKARKLKKLFYSFSKNGTFCKDFELKGQIRRAAVSVMANIAEGLGRGGNKEFIQFLFVSKGSLTEVQSHLYVAFDQEYVDSKKFQTAYDKADEVARLMTSFIQSVESSAKKGFNSAKYANNPARRSDLKTQHPGS